MINFLIYIPALFISLTIIAILYTVYLKNDIDDNEDVWFMLGFASFGVISIFALFHNHLVY